MSSISGTQVAAPVVPIDTNDTYPTHDERYGAGGYRTVADLTARDAIPTGRRRDGMRVYVRATDTLYQLARDNMNAADAGTWTALRYASAAQGAAADQVAGEVFIDSATTFAVGSYGEIAWGWANQALSRLAAFISISGLFVIDKLDVLRGLNLNGSRIQNVAAPSADTDAANRGYVTTSIAAAIPALASDAQAIAKTATDRVVTPANLAAVFAERDVNSDIVNDPNITLTVSGYGAVVFGWANAALTKLAGFITTSGLWAIDKLEVIRKLSLGSGVAIEPAETQYDFYVADSAGNPGFGTSRGRVFTGVTGDIDLTLGGAAALARSRGAARTANLAGLIAGDNIILSYGQSLSGGAEGFPGLTAPAPLSNVKAVIDQGSSESAWSPAPALVDLVAGNLDASSFAPGDGRGGEAPTLGLCYAAKEIADQALQLLPGDATRRIVSIVAGIGGKSLEQLSKINTADSTTRYVRMTQSIDNAVSLASTASRAVSCPAILWIQGDSDYGTINNSVADHKAKLKTLITDMQADIVARTGQRRPPAFLSFQLSGRVVWNTDKAGADALPIPVAQWDAVRETPGAYMIGPYYQVTDKGTSTAVSHLDPNGYRWLGEYAAKVFEAVVIHRRGWRPLSPTRVRKFDRDIFVDYFVPVGDLQWGTIYQQTTGVAALVNAQGVATYGFRVTDTLGDVGILSVSIVGGATVRIQCRRAPIGAAFVWYGSSEFQGAGNLRDSDPAVGRSNYEYQAGRGQYAGANIPELVGKPYPLFNWAILGRWPVGYTEF
jgi:hypothetical protein